MKFRKKPVVIDAMQAWALIDYAKHNWPALPVWMRDLYDKGGVVFTDRTISIPTLEGTMEAQYNDWVICGVKGECYPCKPDIFEASYEQCE